MGFLSRLKKSQAANEEWKILDKIDQLEAIDLMSGDRPVILFKHSTTCGISASAKHRLESGWSDIKEKYDLYYLDLLSYRDVSDAIADRYGVRHQSPQVLVIRDGIAVYDASHHHIDTGVLQNT